jgi:hypothetical protein
LQSRLFGPLATAITVAFAETMFFQGTRSVPLQCTKQSATATVGRDTAVVCLPDASFFSIAAGTAAISPTCDSIPPGVGGRAEPTEWGPVRVAPCSMQQWMSCRNASIQKTEVGRQGILFSYSKLTLLASNVGVRMPFFGDECSGPDARNAMM